jgi:hypothetical protein
MGVILPNERISRLWNGALEKRVRQSPLELYLSTHHLELAPTGPGRVSNNLCRATIHLIDPLVSHAETEPRAEQSKVAMLACAVSHGLAASIDEMQIWRIAALVTAGHLLTPRWGSVMAARNAAIAIEGYHTHCVLKQSSGVLHAVATAARALLNAAGADALTTAMSAYLVAPPGSSNGAEQASQLPQLPWEQRN